MSAKLIEALVDRLGGEFPANIAGATLADIIDVQANCICGAEIGTVFDIKVPNYARGNLPIGSICVTRVKAALMSLGPLPPGWGAINAARLMAEAIDKPRSRMRERARIAWSYPPPTFEGFAELMLDRDNRAKALRRLLRPQEVDRGVLEECLRFAGVAGLVTRQMAEDIVREKMLDAECYRPALLRAVRRMFAPHAGMLGHIELAAATNANAFRTRLQALRPWLGAEVLGGVLCGSKKDLQRLHRQEIVPFAGGLLVLRAGVPVCWHARHLPRLFRVHPSVRFE